jgi:hypothetical protein
MVVAVHRGVLTLGWGSAGGRIGSGCGFPVQHVLGHVGSMQCNTPRATDCSGQHATEYNVQATLST